MAGLRLMTGVGLTLFPHSADSAFDTEWMRRRISGMGLELFEKECKIDEGPASATEVYLTCDCGENEVFEDHLMVLTADHYHTFLDAPQGNRVVEDPNTHKQYALHYLNSESMVINLNYGMQSEYPWYEPNEREQNPERIVHNHFSIPFYPFHGHHPFKCDVYGLLDDDLSSRKVARFLNCGPDYGEHHA